MALLGAELVDRIQGEEQAKHKATAGENGGAHSLGFEVLCAVDDCPWKEQDGTQLRRSIVLDELDQRMQFAMALAVPVDWKGSMFRASLCLLHMEEDEAADGFPWIVGTDDQPLICTEERFHFGSVRVTARCADSTTHPVARRGIDDEGISQFELEMDNFVDKTTVFCFCHEDTGAELEIQLGTMRKPHRGKAYQSTVASDRNFSGSAATYFDDEDEEDEELNEFERDGFIVMDAEENENLDEDDDVCCICKGTGEVMICDGGDHLEGCGLNFHIACVNRNQVPEGDWVCQTCANASGLAVGKEGHEFHDDKQEAETRLKRESAGGESSEDFGEFSSGPDGAESDSSLEIVPARKKSKRARAIDSDDGDD